MMKYNILYEANGERVELRGLTREEAREFINGLDAKYESSLIVKRVEEPEQTVSERREEREGDER